jgi:catechol 2,3-dioxygenase-like lactoylglutathione lyase family enzyme
MDDLLETTVNAEEGRRHSNANIDMKLEAIVIPVSDVDRTKEFYTRLGWRLDADHAGGNGFRLIQFTPPGSGSSIQFGVNLTPAAPGSSPGFAVGCL